VEIPSPPPPPPPVRYYLFQPTCLFLTANQVHPHPPPPPPVRRCPFAPHALLMRRRSRRCRAVYGALVVLPQFPPPKHTSPRPPSTGQHKSKIYITQYYRQIFLLILHARLTFINTHTPPRALLVRVHTLSSHSLSVTPFPLPQFFLAPGAISLCTSVSIERVGAALTFSYPPLSFGPLPFFFFRFLFFVTPSLPLTTNFSRSHSPRRLFNPYALTSRYCLALRFPFRLFSGPLFARSFFACSSTRCPSLRPSRSHSGSTETRVAFRFLLPRFSSTSPRFRSPRLVRILALRSSRVLIALYALYCCAFFHLFFFFSSSFDSSLAGVSVLYDVISPSAFSLERLCVVRVPVPSFLVFPRGCAPCFCRASRSVLPPAADETSQ